MWSPTGTLGSLVYASAPFHREGLTVEQVNGLVVQRPQARRPTRARLPTCAPSRRGGWRPLLALRARAFRESMCHPRSPSPGRAGARGSMASPSPRAPDWSSTQPRTAVREPSTACPCERRGRRRTVARRPGALPARRFRAELRWSAGGESGAALATAVGHRRRSFAVPGASRPIKVQVLDSCARNGTSGFRSTARRRRLRLSVLDT
jgi:hypothetical protein